MTHKLFGQLSAADCSDEDIEDLYHDLKYVFDNPFNEQIELAMARNCAYVEVNQPVAH